MSTRSMIAKLNTDGSIRANYCHFDGYPESVGKTLITHYTDSAKIDALLALGQMSVLGAEIGEQHPFDNHNQFSGEGYKPEYENWTLFYGRDRGESNTEPQDYPSIQEYRNGLEKTWCEWQYLYRDGQWLTAHMSDFRAEGDSTLRPVTEWLDERADEE